MIERLLAATATLVMPVALRTLPLQTTLRLSDAWPRVGTRRITPAALARRVDRWLRHGRSAWRPTCLTRTLVLYTMMRQHGYTPTLHIATHGRATGFRAHAWASLGGITVGEPGSLPADYRELVRHGA